MYISNMSNTKVCTYVHDWKSCGEDDSGKKSEVVKTLSRSGRTPSIEGRPSYVLWRYFLCLYEALHQCMA